MSFAFRTFRGALVKPFELLRAYYPQAMDSSFTLSIVHHMHARIVQRTILRREYSMSFFVYVYVCMYGCRHGRMRWTGVAADRGSLLCVYGMVWGGVVVVLLSVGAMGNG